MGMCRTTGRSTASLNLELGLRYQHGTPLYTTGNNVTNFDPSRFDFSRAVTVTPAGLVVPNSGNPYNGLIRAGSGVPSRSGRPRSGGQYTGRAERSDGRAPGLLPAAEPVRSPVGIRLVAAG